MQIPLASLNITTGDRTPRYPYLTPGVYSCRIYRIERRQSRRGADLLAIELWIAACESETLRPSSRAVAFVKLSDANYGVRNLRGFAAAALLPHELSAASEYPPEALVEWIASDAQPLVGRPVDATVDRITTRAGRPFDRITWRAPS